MIDHEKHEVRGFSTQLESDTAALERVHALHFSSKFLADRQTIAPRP